MDDITSRILKVCAGNPGSLTVFAQLVNTTNHDTLQMIITRAENEQWTSSKPWEIFRSCNQNIDLFIERFKTPPNPLQPAAEHTFGPETTFEDISLACEKSPYFPICYPSCSE